MGKKIWNSFIKTLVSIRGNMAINAQKLMALGKRTWSGAIKSWISMKENVVTTTQKLKIKIGPLWTRTVAICGAIAAILGAVAAICGILDYLGIYPTDKADIANDVSVTDSNNSESGSGDQFGSNLMNSYPPSSQIITSPGIEDIDETQKSDSKNIDNDDYVEPEQEKASTPSNTITISSEEIIRNQQELIFQQKSKYTSADTINIKNSFVSFVVQEKAAEMSYILEGTDQMTSEPIGGKLIPSATIIIIDYETDDVIYTLISDESGHAAYHPSDLRMFYSVTVTYDYQIFVSPPIRLMGDEYSEPNFVWVFLEKPYSIYTQKFQIRVNARDRSNTVLNHSVWANQIANVKCVISGYEDYDDFKSSTYMFDTNNSGIISLRETPCYFSLNTQYVFYISLGIWDTSYVMIDSSLKNTDIVEIYLEYTE